uniref:Putative RNA-directed DNA polymerase, eukaryota, Reverse transcriptase zinc-binding domain protein n=1 Tax=Helianthus annuus TaxID=4232 RepID=A0A251TXQ6_HELAN
MEYQMGGRKYTYHSDNGMKMSKIDRFLVCRNFMNTWPEAFLVALANAVSDHCPLLLTTIPNDFGPIPARIFNSWLELPGLMEYVEQICSGFAFDGPADLRLSIKLKWLKFKIKDWVKNFKATRDGLYVDKVAQLEKLEEIAEERSLMPHELETRAKLKSFISEVDRLKFMDLQQKSRVRWAVEGDENTAYFHGVVNANISSNRLNGLRINDIWVTSPPLIKDTVCNFFASKFQEPLSSRPVLICPNLATITEDEAAVLVAPFSVMEVKKAVWDCEGDRAPGPDGINFRFIKKCWGLLQNDFIMMMDEFFEKEAIHIGCTSSFLALIPKCNDPGGLLDYRPISLIGSINKVVSKVLVNRLKTVMQKLISEEQTAFLANRSILDGPLILNELIPWLKRRKKAGLIFKVDIEKAYDSLNWEFLNSIMAQMNFPLKWRNWIMAIVSSVKASVLVNGSPTQEFKCYRGLRQGDPISPFLFIIAMEALSGVMKKACTIGLYKGIKCSTHGPLLSHFLYADDAVFVGEWSRENVLNLNRILRCFYLASGLRVNLKKSNLHAVGVSDVQLSDMASLLRCKAGVFPFKHLGLQVGANMNLVKNWRPVFDVFKKRLSAWKAKTLSFGGRITLIKSVLSSLPTYFFSLFKAPVQVINHLERLRRDFLWGASPEQKKIIWVAWNNVLVPKDYGGVGIGSLWEANVSMLAKWWWRFKAEPNGLWRKVIWSFHHTARSWNFIPVSLSISGPWKQVVKIQDELSKEGINLRSLFKGMVGHGRDIQFWTACWFGEEPLANRFPNLFCLESCKHVAVADRLVEENGVFRFRARWKRRPNSTCEVRELQEIAAALSDVSFGTGQDYWVWKLNASGSFTVNSMRRLVQKVRSSDLGTGFQWNSWAPIKVNFLAWRLSLDRIPTLMALARRQVNLESTICRFCGEMDESADHLFVGCGFTQVVWDFVARWCNIRPFYALDVKDLVNMHMHVNGPRKWQKAYYTVILTTIWSIWKCRNEVIFNQKEPKMERLIEEIRTLSYLWVRNRSKSLGLTWGNWSVFDLSCMVS